MDTSRFKPGQLKCVTTLDAPLVVSAGAGSGKTFTLTQRIAWALMPGSGADGGPFLDDVGQVLAITFTRKAADEIKSRVKTALRSEGMPEQALKVDGAWISTIHGMCARILRTHAVELGIDPAFNILAEDQAQAMLDEAVEEALAGTNEFVNPAGLERLFSEFSGRSTYEHDRTSVEAMVKALVQAAAASPRGCGCFELPPVDGTVAFVAEELCLALEEARDAAQGEKPGKSRDAWLERTDLFLADYAADLKGGQLSSAQLLRIANELPWPAATFGVRDYKDRVKELQAECAFILARAVALHTQELLEQLVQLAAEVLCIFQKRKRDEAMLDNNDLLIMTARAFEECPAIAQEFADKFKLVMVDEFQDTDQLQIDIISRMAGPGQERLCTVGDAQQSIYRFRGADVAVYQRHLAHLKESNPACLIELPDNFRSHRDVLSLVDRVFEQGHVFGRDFMSLAPSRAESKVAAPLRSGERRVRVLLTTYPARQGVDAREVRALEARRIAQAFEEYRAAGHEPSEMVVLLGRMTNAGVYAQALRDAGFACVIAGGSVFSRAPEVRTMVRLAQVIANPHATAALFEVLSSEMFALSADDFVELATRHDDDLGLDVRRSLDEGFEQLARNARQDALMPEGLRHALGLVGGFADKVGRAPVSRIMSDALRESGWIARLEARGAEGQSIAGNLYKAIRIVEACEAQGITGAASVAQALAAHVDMAKEAPGSLSAKGGNSVRIMTVHASKGLEFPIVAVAEMEQTAGRAQAFSCTTVDGTAYLSLMGCGSMASLDQLKKRTKGAADAVEITDASPEAIARATSAPVRAKLVADYEQDQELKERRRLLYVALTRAKEALVVAMTSKRNPKQGELSGVESGVYDDIRSALFGEGDFPLGSVGVDFGGTMPALVERIDLQAPAEEDVEEQGAGQPLEEAGGEAGSFAIPEPAEPSRLTERPAPSLRDGVVSYTALASGEEHVPLPYADPVNDDDDDSFWDALSARLSADADKATDVGSAFHLLAQYAVLARSAAGGKGGLGPVDEGRITAVAQGTGVQPAAQQRLNQALARWFASEPARMAASYKHLHAELPFFVRFEAEGAPAYLEGSIDLFACQRPLDAPAGEALIVDYKTGGNDAETPEALRRKHELQAICYAYATLLQGYDRLKAVFVRVERASAEYPDQPQCVEYAFDQADLPMLLERIQEAYGAYLRSQDA